MRAKKTDICRFDEAQHREYQVFPKNTRYRPCAKSTATQSGINRQ